MDVHYDELYRISMEQQRDRARIAEEARRASRNRRRTDEIRLGLVIQASVALTALVLASVALLMARVGFTRPY